MRVPHDQPTADWSKVTHAHDAGSIFPSMPCVCGGGLLLLPRRDRQTSLRSVSGKTSQRTNASVTVLKVSYSTLSVVSCDRSRIVRGAFVTWCYGKCSVVNNGTDWILIHKSDIMDKQTAR